MALLGPDSSQIAREVWAERRVGAGSWNAQEESGSRLFAVAVGSCLYEGESGDIDHGSLWSLNQQLLRVPWREVASVISNHTESSWEMQGVSGYIPSSQHRVGPGRSSVDVFCVYL